MFAEKDQAIAEYLRRTRRQLTAAACPSMNVLAQVGDLCWQLTYQHAQSDDAAVERYFRHYDPYIYQLSGYQFQPITPEDQIAHLGAARWRSCGYPKVEVGHKYAAALMASAISSDATDAVLPPWPAFAILIPSGLLQTLDASVSKQVNLVYMIVHTLQLEGRSLCWNYIAFSDEAISLWSHGLNTAQLLSGVQDDDFEGEWGGTPFAEAIDDQDKRVDLLLRRLIASVCLAMSDPESCKNQARVRPSTMPLIDIRGEPRLWNFQLGKPLKIDVREHVMGFVHGRKSSAPSVQTLVRGHFRRQAHGPQHALRKVIWIEPFWRGDEDAPVLVRPVQLKGP